MLRTKWWVLFLLTAALGVAAGAPALSNGDRAAASGDKAAVAKWIERLAADQAEEAERAADELVRLGEKARAALEEAAASKDPRLAERAREVLERLDEGSGREGEDEESGAGESGGWPRFPRLGPLPRFSWNDDDWQNELERWQKEFDESIRRWNQEMEQWLKRFRGPNGFSWRMGEPSSMRGSYRVERTGPDGSHESLAIEIGPEGKVKAKVLREKDGKRTEERYEADSFEQFQREHPDIAKNLGFDFRSGPGLHAFRFSWPGEGGFTGPRGWLQRFQRRFGDGWRQPSAPFAVPAEGPRLGIQVREIPEDDPLRAQLGLAAGVGLLVEEVMPGTLAEELGLRRHDILLSVNGRGVAHPDDVRRALSDTPPEQVRVKVLRGGRERTLVKGV